MVSHLYNISFIFLTSPFMVDFIVYIRVIRVIRSSYHPLCSFVIMSFCLAENHLSPSVIVLFCLKNILCLRPSLCYSVSKKSSVFIRLYVILSSKKSFVSICHYVILSQINHLSPFVIMSFCLKKSHLSPFVIMSFCLQKNHLSPFVIMSFCLKNLLCLRLSLCYSVSNNPPVFICPYVTLSPIYSVCIVLKSLDNDVYKGLG